MEFTEEKRIEFLREVFNEWAPRADQRLRDELRKREGFVPSDTLALMRYDLASNLEDRAYELLFHDPARLVEMRDKVWDKRPVRPGDNFIAAWAQKYKARVTGPVPGYKPGATPGISEEKQQERRANAIIVAKGNNTTKTRIRKNKWYNKLIYSMIQELIRLIVRSQADWLRGYTIEQITETFKSNGTITII